MDIQGCAGDVWYPQPAPATHPWRTMPRNGMTIHYSGMTLESQQRIEDGVKDILTRFLTMNLSKRKILLLIVDVLLVQAIQQNNTHN